MSEIKKAKESKTPNFILRFKAPVKWEDKQYDSVDLSGIESLTTNDLEDAYRTLAQDAGVAVAAVPEYSFEYCCIIASKSCGLPIEFFEQLPAKHAIALRAFMRNYFFAED